MKISLILLAAGNSRRFRGNKLLYEFHGKAMYRYVIDEIQSLKMELFSQKIVVSQYPEILNDLQKEGFLAVKNDDPNLGISHSIHLGMNASDRETEAWCFLVCDQPYLKGETILRLVKEWERSGLGMGCVGWKENMGNPVIFSNVYKEKLMQLTGDVGGRRILNLFPNDVCVVQVQDQIELEDVDEKKM